MLSLLIEKILTMKKYRSVAIRDSCHGFYENKTTDEHETREEAESVLKLLKREGLGGERIWFPIKTYVEDIKPEDIKNYRKRKRIRYQELPYDVLSF